ncbi:MAG TPA: porphobilinogen synthase, partial [Puia sp.]|nr:porphobilinogen synthase [Puia sp.]
MQLKRRNRILRANHSIRSLVSETSLSPNDFIVPLFLEEGKNKKNAIPSMPGYYRLSLDLALKEVKELWNMGLKSVLIFIKCKDELKDNKGTEA